MSPRTKSADAVTPTRQRLIDAALPLFAKHGYERTTVGEIEVEAGLVPRSGGLYNHFPSKRALLGAALAQRMDAIDALDERMELLPLGDLGAELTLIGRLALAELESQRELAQIVIREGDRFPEFATDFHDALVARGRSVAINWLQMRSQELGLAIPDPEATGEMLADALVGRALKGFMFGDRLGVVDRDRYLAAWVDATKAVLSTDQKESR